MCTSTPIFCRFFMHLWLWDDGVKPSHVMKYCTSSTHSSALHTLVFHFVCLFHFADSSWQLYSYQIPLPTTYLCSAQIFQHCTTEEMGDLNRRNKKNNEIAEIAFLHLSYKYSVRWISMKQKYAMQTQQLRNFCCIGEKERRKKG